MRLKVQHLLVLDLHLRRVQNIILHGSGEQDSSVTSLRMLIVRVKNPAFRRTILQRHLSSEERVKQEFDRLLRQRPGIHRVNTNQRQQPVVQVAWCSLNPADNQLQELVDPKPDVLKRQRVYDLSDSVPHVLEDLKPTLKPRLEDLQGLYRQTCHDVAEYTYQGEHVIV